MPGGERRIHWKRWVAIGVVAAALAVVGGPYVYIHFIEGSAPAPLALTTPTASSTSAMTGSGSGQTTSSTDGAWAIADGSVVGYRVKEVLFGQSNTAVGRTGSITGSMTVSGTTITKASFTIDMASVTSDQSRRDGQFNGRIMDTSAFPTATFTLTQPVDLGSIPAQGVQRSFTVTGDLTLHGVTKTITFTVTGQYTGSLVQVAGSIPISFADWNIPNPSFGGVVSTEDHGVLEFALNFARG